MPRRLWPAQAFDGTGNVEQRFAIPSSPCPFGGVLDTQPVGQAAMMMHVINQRHASVSTGGRQVGGRISLVIVFQREARAHGCGETLNGPAQRLKRGGLVTVSAAGVEIDGVRADPFSDFVAFVSLPDMNTGVVMAIFCFPSFAPVMKWNRRMKLPSSELPLAAMGVSTTVNAG